MFRRTFTRVGVPAAVAAVLLMAAPAWAQHGGGGHGGGFHGGGGHAGGFHGGGGLGGGFHSGGGLGGGFHGGNPHVGSFHPGGFHSDRFHSDRFHSDRFRGGGYYPGYYPGYDYGYYPSDSYSPSYDLEYGSAPDLGSLDSYGEVAPSYSSGYQALEPPSTVSPDTASAPADPIALVTVRVPANAELWFDGTRTTSTGSVREFKSPPLSPGRYTYEIRARWTENGRDITQTQKVAVSPGTHMTADFPISGQAPTETQGGTKAG